MTPSQIWQATCSELEHQMTKATFNSWLKGANLLEATEEVFRIGVKNDYARDWLENRLVETIDRALSQVAGRPLHAVFVVQLDENLPAQQPLLAIAETPPPGIDLPDYQFDGFEAPKANFVQIPHALIDEVLPHVRPTVGVLILVVFRRTVGVIIHQDGSRKKEWITTYRDMALAANIGSMATTRVAIWEARAMGLMVLREIEDPVERKLLIQQEQLAGTQQSQLVMGLRPRWRGEPVDYPTDPKPKR